MRLGTKKLLSLALAGALVVGGANVGGTVKKASADDVAASASPAASADASASPAASADASASPAASADASATPAASADASASPAASADASATPAASADASASPAASADASAAPAASADASAAPAASAAPVEALPYGAIGEVGAEISTPFVANIDSWGTVTGWDAPANEESKLSVSKFGEYQISTVATQDIDDLKAANAFDLGLDLTAAPVGFDVIGESVTIAGTEYALNQETARLYLDDKSWRVGISNAWNPKEWANTFTTAEAIAVNEGDVVTIKFKVVEGEYAHFGEEEEAVVSPAPEATDTPAASTKNACKKVVAAKKTVSVKQGKSATLTFKLTNTTASKKTTDKITVASSNKKVTAKVSKKAAKKVTVKVTVKKNAKKGSKANITLKVGKKSAKTTVKVAK